MSVAMGSTSGEVGEDSVNLMATGNRWTYGWRPQLSVWWIGAAAVCLGFLLLILILGVVAHISSAVSHRDSHCETLIYSLTIDKDSLIDERDQLQINNRNLTREMEVLQSQYQAVVASRDKLQEEVNGLTLNKRGKSCHQGWKPFGDKCYYFSPQGATKTWDNSRKDCKERGADLAIVTTIEEVTFVSKAYSLIWIGLSDKEQENKWKWVDGTDFRSDEFWKEGEPNNADNEDCVEIIQSSKKFNDVVCSRKYSWVCED